MKYTQEMSDKLAAGYAAGRDVQEMATELNVPKRSVIAKLSSLGVYKAKTYVNKRGEQPVKKEAHILKVAQLLGIDVNLLDSMEKVTKTALVLIEEAVLKMQKEDADEVQYWRSEYNFIENELERLKVGLGIDKSNLAFPEREDNSDLTEPSFIEPKPEPLGDINSNPFSHGIAANAPQKIVGAARDDPSYSKLAKDYEPIHSVKSHIFGFDFVDDENGDSRLD